MAWNLTSDRPVFLQIVERLKLDIITGVFQPGDKLPTVRDLANEASVNPNTMQRAFAQLEREGLVYTMRTSGRYITEDHSMIMSLKEQMAVNTIAEFLKRMEELGYPKEETMHLIEDAIQRKGEE